MNDTYEESDYTSLAMKIDTIMHRSPNHFWTVERIARELGVEDHDRVERALRLDMFRMSYFSTEDGRPLYTLAENKVHGKERIVQFLDNISSLFE